jgi:hypothetical protein
MPTTTTGASTSVPSLRTTLSTRPLPRISRTPVPNRRSTPLSRWTPAKNPPSSGPDPAPADHDDPTPALERLADALRVGQGAQVEDAVEIGARQRQPAWLRPGRDEQLVVALVAAVAQHDLVGRPVDRRHPGAEPQVDAVLGVPALVVHVGLVAARGALHELLR